MYHDQECCESVYIADINGAWSDIINFPILRAEERTEDIDGEYELITYTFYNIATIKGEVTIRWNGASNGYYSVGVDLYEDS